ncbi:hypothetical protein [Vibrio gigantis]|uniref:hypothetical protein n=1 Tax=Vibrio gigantis TaxID=296199 RepID=UPI003B84A2B6
MLGVFFPIDLSRDFHNISNLLLDITSFTLLYTFKHQYSSTSHLFEKIILTVRLSALTYVILSILLLASNKHVMQQNNNEGR